LISFGLTRLLFGTLLDSVGFGGFLFDLVGLSYINAKRLYGKI